MTPQLQQAIKLLQLGRHEYLEVLEKELLENPVLEDDRYTPSSDGAADGDGPSDASSQAQTRDIIDEFSPKVLEVPSDAGTEEFDQISFDTDNFFGNFNKDSKESDGAVMDWRDYFDTYSEAFHSASGVPSRFTDDEEKPSLEAVLTRPEGLTTHLLWQIRTSDLAKEDHEIALQLIGNLDRNGYLCGSLEEIAQTCGRTVADVENVLFVIQGFDPPGVGARDLRECLMVQLAQLGMTEGLVAALVDRHLEKLEMRRYEIIAKEENVSIEEVYEAVREVKKLEPRPGRQFIDDPPIYVTPDIYVRKVGEDYVISLNETGMPRLRLNPRYRELLVNGKLEELPNKEYLQDRLRSAAWLIKSIHQRQQTIYKVTESIMKFQREFLDKGIGGLRPLVLRDVAGDVGMHESTISRVTTNKYVHTPQGIFELKFFFSSALKSGYGEVSSESVKEKIRTLVGTEDPRKPMSDQAIVENLRKDGIDIARRTVAKYREMLNILSSSRRKKVL